MYAYQILYLQYKFTVAENQFLFKPLLGQNTVSNPHMMLYLCTQKPTQTNSSVHIMSDTLKNHIVCSLPAIVLIVCVKPESLRAKRST